MYISLQNSSDNVKDISVTIRWMNHYFHIFVEYHYIINSFLGKLVVFALSFLCLGLVWFGLMAYQPMGAI